MIKGLLTAMMTLYTVQASAAPVALKVEPPGWWAGHTVNPVRMMVRGRGLAGARFRSESPDLVFGPTKINAAGTALFVDVTINPRAVPGVRSIGILTPSGKTSASFEILKPLSPSGRFQGFSPDDVVYLIMLDRFANGDKSNDDPAKSRGLHDRSNIRFYHGGDLQGVIQKLDYLKDLGVTALWITPIYDNADRVYPPSKDVPEPYTDYHGYEAVDFYAVDEHFGDVAKLRELVDRAHAKGLKIILDQVANHVGPQHPWVSDPPTPTWFNGTPENHLNNSWQGWTLVDPHASRQLRESVLSGWYAGILPDLNQSDPEVSRSLIQNSLWWLGVSGADGLRLDTASYLPRPFLSDWMGAVKKQYPGMSVTGEAYDHDSALVSFFQGGQKRYDGVDSGLDSVFDFPLQKAMERAFLQGRPATELPLSLAHDYLYPNPGMLITQIGSHDEVRFLSRPGSGIDQLKLAFSLLMTTRGIPMIYYGDEVAMSGQADGGLDPANRRDFPGGWSDDKADAFSAAGRTPEQQAVFAHVQRLARLRSELEPLRRGELVNLAADDHVYAYARITGKSWAIVVVNSGDKEERADFAFSPVPLDPATTTLMDRLGAAAARVEGGRVKATLPPRSAAIYSPAAR